MRARHQRVIATLLAAIAIAFAAMSGPSVMSVQAGDPLCPNGTSWDNRVQRCV